MRDPNTARARGTGVFGVDPGRFPGGQPSMRMTCCHAPAATTLDLHPAPIVRDTFQATQARSGGALGD